MLAYKKEYGNALSVFRDAVIVLGCGYEGADGVYVLGSSPGAASKIYIRKVAGVDYSMQQVQDQGGNLVWLLLAVMSEGEAKGQAQQLYVNMAYGASPTPPSNDWAPAADQLSPAPTVRAASETYALYSVSNAGQAEVNGHYFPFGEADGTLRYKLMKETGKAYVLDGLGTSAGGGRRGKLARSHLDNN